LAPLIPERGYGTARRAGTRPLATPTEAASAVTGTLRSASPGFSAQTTPGVGQMGLAAAEHREQPRGGHASSTRAVSAGRARPVATCTVNNVHGREKRFRDSLLISVHFCIV